MRLLGIKEEKKEEKREEEKVVPIINFVKQIVVNFVDLAKSPEGRENILRVHTEVFKEKPYLEYLNTLTTPEERSMAQIIRRYQYSYEPTNKEGTEFSLKLCPIAPKR